METKDKHSNLKNDIDVILNRYFSLKLFSVQSSKMCGVIQEHLFIY